MSSSSLAGRYHNWNGKSFEFGQSVLKFWIKLLTILVQRMPNLFAGLVVDNANVIGSFGRSVICPPEIARKDVLGTLVPFKTDQRNDCQMRMAVGFDGVAQGIRLFAGRFLNGRRVRKAR